MGVVQKDHCVACLKENKECKIIMDGCNRLTPLSTIGEEPMHSQFLNLSTDISGKINQAEFLDFAVGVTNSFETSRNPINLSKKSNSNNTVKTKEPSAEEKLVQNQNNGETRDKTLASLWAQIQESDHIDVEEVQFDLHQVNINVPSAELQFIISKYTSKEYSTTNGRDSFINEILVLARKEEDEKSKSEAAENSQLREVQKLFHEIDYDSTGSVDEEKLLRFISELALANTSLELPNSQEDIRQVLKILDTDKSGEIDGRVCNLAVIGIEKAGKGT